MIATKLSNFPPSYLKDLRERADENVTKVVAAWRHPELSKEDMDTLKLVSMILVTMAAQPR